ncbi:MAG TPA: hypothetical protein VGK73_29505 [Polyangiaceae bacterium]
MRNGLSWLTLGLAGLLVGAPACGEDEATGDDDVIYFGECREICNSSSNCRDPNDCIQVGALPPGNGVCARPNATTCCDPADSTKCRTDLTGDTVEETGSGGSSGGGGKGGSGGSFLGGSSGSTGKGGSAGSGGNDTNDTALGAPCTEDADCNDDRMICMTSEFLDGDGPPGGLCTLSCTSHGQCLEITDNAFCIGFSETDSYCLEPCQTGSEFEPKCHERDDFACGVAFLTGNDTVECESSNDCSGNQLCGNDGFCGDPIFGCLPTCGADSQCDSGHCDFLSGFCVEEKADDLLPIGSLCTPVDDDEPQPCDGFCVPLADDPTQGECMAFCVNTTTGVGCGFDGSEPAEAACLFGTIFSPPDDVGLNDIMICGKMCDCNQQCPIPGDTCIGDSTGTLEAVFGRQGYCRTPDGATEDDLGNCPGSGGTGGMGGTAGTGGGGASGEGGTGGNAGEAGDTGSAGDSPAQGGQGGAP